MMLDKFRQALDKENGRAPIYEANNRATRRRYEKALGRRAKSPRSITSRKPVKHNGEN